MIVTGLGAVVAGAAAAGGMTAAQGAGEPVVACRSHRPHCLASGRMTLSAHGRVHRAAWSGRFTSRALPDWEQRQAAARGVAIVAAPRLGRRRVARFTVRPGDRPVVGGERAEVAASAAATGGLEGSERWYAWSTYFPADLNPVPNATWNVFTQWHATGDDHCSPNVAMQVNTRARPARLRLAVRGGRLAVGSCAPQATMAWDTVVLESERWYDFALHVRWSAHPRRGLVELAVDGRVVVAPTTVPTLYPGQGVYVKQGFYRGPSTTTSRIYHGGITSLR
jgi:polysaccharide lyase-like protein